VCVCAVCVGVCQCDLVLANEMQLGKCETKERGRARKSDGERYKTGESEISALYESLKTVGHFNVTISIISSDHLK